MKKFILIFYPPTNKLISLTDPNGDTFTFIYDKLGRRIRVNYPNGTYTTYSYNSKSQIIQVNTYNTSRLIGTHTYKYDEVGNRITLDIKNLTNQSLPFKKYRSTLDELPSIKHSIKIEYTYNDKDQLIEELATRIMKEKKEKIIREYKTIYRYDLADNLIEKEVYRGNKGKEGKKTTYFYDYNNLLPQITYPDREINIFKNCT